jgi:hypothetical protein
MDKLRLFHIPQMTPTKTFPVALAMFTLVCTLPATGVIPLAIAQEDITSLDEDLVRGIVSDILDGGDDGEEENDSAADSKTNQDSTDTATVDPNPEDQTVDQTDFNEFGNNTAISIDRAEEEQQQQQQLRLTSPPDNALLQSEDAVFCFQQGLILGILCSDTLEDCDVVQERFEKVISECEEFETSPPDAAFCSVSEEGKNIKCKSPN